MTLSIRWTALALLAALSPSYPRARAGCLWAQLDGAECVAKSFIAGTVARQPGKPALSAFYARN